MARPFKQGIGYYPLDVDFLKDLKVRKIVKAHGAIAPVILISLLSNIYRDYGYYVVWDKDMPFLIADEVGVSEGAVDEVVRKAIQVEFFCEKVYEEYNVLTSRGIQERFLKATERRKGVTMIAEYTLIENNNPIIAGIKLVNVCNNPVNAVGSTQSKVKKRIVKESINTSPDTASAVPAAKEYDKDGVEYKSSKYLADKILIVNPRARVPKDDAGLFKWCVHIDRLLRLDGKSPDELREVLAFAVRDPFWSANILSTKNFREKYDQLYAKIKQGGARPNGINRRNTGRGKQSGDPYREIKSTDV